MRSWRSLHRHFQYCISKFTQDHQMYNLGDDLNDAITDIKARHQHEPEYYTPILILYF